MSQRIQLLPRRARAPIAPVVMVSQPNRVLHCVICEDWTAHALTTSGDVYVCGTCAFEIVHITNPLGIDLTGHPTHDGPNDFCNKEQ